MATTSLPATKKDKPKSIRELLEGDNFKLQVARALPTHLKPDRFIRVAITAMTRTPKLAECDQASFFNALLTLSQLGLEPDGRRAHLIPFNNKKRNCVECQLIVDYKGLVELVMNTGNCSNIHADVVCENDKFVYDKGEIKEHTIDFRTSRGPWYAAYAIIRFKDGTEKCEVMTKEEVLRVRDRSRAKDDGPWVTDEIEMAKKTVFRRATKWVKLSPEQRDIIEADDSQYGFDEKEAHSTAKQLADRIKASRPAETPEIELNTAESAPIEDQGPETPAPEGMTAPDETENRIQGYLDTITVSSDIKTVDAAYGGFQEDVKACRFLPSEQENETVYMAYLTKKKALSKKR